MRLFGLIGYPLHHAFSGRYFANKFERERINDCRYALFPLPRIEDLPSLLINHPSLEGLNVTIPYKKAVKNYLDTVEGEAYQIGAVNTVKIYPKGKDRILKGFNTDVYGFRVSLEPLIDSIHENALVLGTGGASLAVTHVLDKLGISYWIVSRKPGADKISYEALTKELISKCKLIINTTPIGTYPAIHEYPPIPYEGIGSDHLLYDLVYNPSETAYLSIGKEKGAVTKNGLEMLEQQAEKSWEIWNNPAQ